MSCVCDTILKFSILENEDKIIDQVNLFFGKEANGFVALDSHTLPKDAQHWYGGSKVFQTPIAIGAFNYLDLAGLKKHLVENVKWEHPEEIQLIYCNENDDKFQIWEPSEEPRR